MNRASLTPRHPSPHVGAALLLLILAGCGEPAPHRLQGYAEGEFVYVASPLAGQLESLAVERGQQVRAGELLFALDSAPEKAARNEAERRLQQSRATLADLGKGRRPTEIASLEAQLNQARAAFTFSEQELGRLAPLAQQGITTQDEMDRARSTRDQNQHRVSQLQADLATGRLGARGDQIMAAEADVRAREAALASAEWSLSQKRQLAPRAGDVFDTLYYQGEWVAAGRPVVALLPPGNIKVRAFVPEPRIGTVRVGQTARVRVDGLAEPLVGKVSFISPREEFTPPVIYSRESRAKLVFMVELRFDPETAAKLHPGQPVDVELE